MSGEEDIQDVERVLGGDVDAFEGIVRRWQGPLVNLAYRFCGDRGMAEEMAQDAFLKAYRGLPKWRRQGAFSTWLFALATNAYRSHLRRRRLPMVPLEAAAQVARSPGQEVAAARGETERLVRQAVRSLPRRYRAAVILYYFHDMDLRQAAASLGLPEGTVKSHLHRGRKLLERHFSEALDRAAPQQEASAWIS